MPNKPCRLVGHYQHFYLNGWNMNCLLNCRLRRRSKKHQSSTSVAFVWGIHRWPVNSPHKRQLTRKMFSFDDVIMSCSSNLHTDQNPIHFVCKLKNSYRISLTPWVIAPSMAVSDIFNWYLAIIGLGYGLAQSMWEASNWSGLTLYTSSHKSRQAFMLYWISYLCQQISIKANTDLRRYMAISCPTPAG